MSEPSDLDLGESKVVPICVELGLSDAVTEAAKKQAKRVDMEYPINRGGKIIAAASVYLQALHKGEKVSQEAVAEAADTTDASVRSCFQDIREEQRLCKEPMDGESPDSVHEYHHLLMKSQRILDENASQWRSRSSSWVINDSEPEPFRYTSEESTE